MKKAVFSGSILLIVPGVLHAVHVGRARDVEPYLWGASLFLVLQGALTLRFVRWR